MAVIARGSPPVGAIAITCGTVPTKATNEINEPSGDQRNHGDGKGLLKIRVP
jgi:hypothetical protein